MVFQRFFKYKIGRDLFVCCVLSLFLSFCVFENLLFGMDVWL